MPNSRQALSAFAAIAMFAASGAAAEDGWYGSVDLGFARSMDTTIAGSDNDWSTKCDRLINPGELETAPGECATAPPRSNFAADFDAGRGGLASLALGYGVARFNFEVEYLYRSTAFDEGVPLRIGDAVTLEKLSQEISSATGRLGDVRAHAAFANIHYRLRDGAWQPYLGVGVGVGRVMLDYAAEARRADDPAQIATFNDPALRARLAGTTTIGEARHSDTMLGYQLLASLERPLNETTALRVRFRWVGFTRFEAADKRWHQLRGHDSTIGRDGDVLWRVATDDAGFWAWSAGVKVRF